MLGVVALVERRPALGTRWSKRVMPAVLKGAMRHKSIDTTPRYYLDHEAQDIATDLWEAYREVSNTFGNTRGQNSRNSPAFAHGTGD